jgi:hypothetical protein
MVEPSAPVLHAHDGHVGLDLLETRQDRVGVGLEVGGLEGARNGPTESVTSEAIVGRKVEAVESVGEEDGLDGLEILQASRVEGIILILNLTNK